MTQDAGLKIIRENTSENLIFSEKFDIIYRIKERRNQNERFRFYAGRRLIHGGNRY